MPEGIVRVKSGTSWAKGGAKYVASSDNAKIGAVDTTWVSIESTCVDCDFKVEGVCYAMGGRSALHVKEREQAKGRNETSLQTSLNEADCIDAAYEGGSVPAGRILRVHSSGDTSTTDGAIAIGRAIDRWLRRGGGVAYTYTHAWRRVPRAAFGRLSVLASLNPGDDARQALANGYGSVTALFTIERWSSRMVLTKDGSFVFRQFRAPETGIDWAFIPCPAQYPVDKDRGKEATAFKIAHLSKAIGVPEKQIRNIFDKLVYGRGKIVRPRRERLGDGSTRIVNIETEVDGIPTNFASTKIMQYADRIVAAGYPHPATEAFAIIFRRIHADEKTTCDECGLCYDDQKRGREKRAIAFRGDQSGGIIETESLLRKVAHEKLQIAMNT
jgi:hypothetical protein